MKEVTCVYDSNIKETGFPLSCIVCGRDADGYIVTLFCTSIQLVGRCEECLKMHGDEYFVLYDSSDHLKFIEKYLKK
jgi:hypothetical protein